MSETNVHKLYTPPDHLGEPFNCVAKYKTWFTDIGIEDESASARSLKSLADEGIELSPDEVEASNKRRREYQDKLQERYRRARPQAHRYAGV
jgi:hypothetical protein